MKILSVDDSKTIRLIVAKAFKPFDCTVVEATNGVEGLAAAAREKPDLIVLDITMPVMDGIEMLGKLKSDPALKAIPVIMLTAESGRENVLKIAKLGVRDYLVKPFKEEQLLDKACRVVNLLTKEAAKGAAKTLSDSALILVIEDKPAIIQQITEGLKTTPWKVDGKPDVAQADAAIKAAKPDVVLISLSLPDDAAYKFFQQLKNGALTKLTPVFGMCLKTDNTSLSRAEQAGFSGIITKPLDMEGLQTKLIKAMNIDVSSRYYSTDGEIQFVSMPPRVTSQTTSEAERFLAAKIEDMANSGMAKLILDLSKVAEIDVSLVKFIITVIQKCGEFSIRIRIVGNPDVIQSLKNFSETGELVIDPSIEEAKKQL
jgi:two-component system cell cycle response regulator